LGLRNNAFDEVFVLTFHRQIEVGPNTPSASDDLFICQRIDCRYFVVFPVQANASLLPAGQVVEIDVVLKQQFVFLANRLLEQSLISLPCR